MATFFDKKTSFNW